STRCEYESNPSYIVMSNKMRIFTNCGRTLRERGLGWPRPAQARGGTAAASPPDYRYGNRLRRIGRPAATRINTPPRRARAVTRGGAPRPQPLAALLAGNDCLPAIHLSLTTDPTATTSSTAPRPHTMAAPMGRSALAVISRLATLARVAVIQPMSRRVP